ncbi:MAG: hypothetical protein ABWZ40_03105 [Caulobacterales bacterium]
MIRWAIILAFLALLVSVAVYVVPFTFTEEWSWRASVGSSISTAIAIILGAIALLITAQVESSDYKSQQEVKSDLAKLLATLSSAQVRAGIKLQADARSKTNLSVEKASLLAFMNSVTGFAFYGFAARKSQKSAGSPQEWRLFHMYLSEMIDTDDVGLFLNRAIRVQNLLTNLKNADLRLLSNAVQDLTRSVANFDNVIENNVLLKAMRGVYGGDAPEQRAPTGGGPEPSFFDSLRLLKQSGIEDPDIEMFLAVDANDTEALKAALDRGGNPNITDSALLARYAEQLTALRQE